MDNDFELELKGSFSEATAAKQQILKYFKRYGDSAHQDAKKHQLMYASKIICAISRCESKHLEIYCNIINDIFAAHLCPEISVKYWTLYVNCIRYFHYLLVEKKEFEKASLIYKHILSYNNKLQSAENSLTYINIYCYQLYLQNSLKSKNPELAISEATEIVKNLTKLFNEVLQTNEQQNFQYPDILKKAMSWLFPQNKAGTVYQFLKLLPEDNVKQMFQALFNLYGRQTSENTSNAEEIQEEAKYIIETLYILLQVDIMDKMHLQLGVLLLRHCCIESRLQSYKPIAESFLLLYDYLKLLCAQKSILDFQRMYSLCCERFKEIFDKYSKTVINQPWFGNFLVLIFFIHSQLQNITIFNMFWKQMSKSICFKSMFELFVETMKLAPCISSETKLFTTSCCTSARKHVILSFAQLALAVFVFYCQNVNQDDAILDAVVDGDSNLTDFYKEKIHNNLILIINHAFKIIDKMNCITSSSQEIEIITTRFKQATLNSNNKKQATTCIAICELFLKIKTKIPNKEWPLLLRRLYKTATQLVTDTPNIGRDIQMCYITSLLQENEIDINQIRNQISIFYAAENTTTTTTKTNNELQPIHSTHEHCIMYLYQTTTCLFKPYLELSRRKLLHWLESQHVIKYYKSNTALLHSILKTSQSHYDFVVITRLAKLQTYAMAKLTSIYKTLKTKATELGTLSRLEQLTLGHICVMLLYDMNANQKLKVESKDLNEDQLENLLTREEMSSFTIHNDLKCYKLAWEAFKAFEEFYEKFDSETINMDDAIIDWECILDDLAGLALCLQLSGCLEYCSHVWLLHYKCSCLLDNDLSALRGLAFFCEFSDLYIKHNNDKDFELDKKIQTHFPTIIHGLENLARLPRQAYQNYILLAVLQIAHYYARLERYSFAQMLLQYVEIKHKELPERQGRYDIVMATMDAIKFRLLGKHFDDSKANDKEIAKRTTAENILLHRCLLHEIEETLDRLHEFSFVTSNDGLYYSILIIGLVQEMAECSINRLCDNFINALFIATCKCTLQLGLPLRFIQVMGMWMWVNLQMEYVQKAQTKLKLIEYVMGIKTLKELTMKSTKSISDIPSSTVLPSICIDLVSPNNHNPGMEAMRRLAQVQLSPIKMDKLQLSPSHSNSDLKRYLKCNIDGLLLPQFEQMEWTFFMVGCLNARLYFLVEEYDQLEMFYERGNRWLQTRQNSFNKKYYKNIQLMSIQHYGNFLRAQHQYDKALQCLEYGIELCENMKFYVDAVYYVNFQLQLIATRKEINSIKNIKINLPTHSKLRRALEFNISPENKHLENKMLSNVIASGKKQIMRPLPSIVTEIGCSSSKKQKTHAYLSFSGSSGITGSTTKPKPKPKFQICEDSLEIMEVTDNSIVNDIAIAKHLPLENDKSIKKTKSPEEIAQLYKTPKPIKKTTKSIKSAAKIKRPELLPQYHTDINLTDCAITSLQKSSSLDNVEANKNFNTNDLIKQMQNLEIKSTKKTKISTVTTLAEDERKIVKTRGRKLNLVKETAETTIIVLEDSPLTIKSAPKEIVDTAKTPRSRTRTRDISPKEQINEDVSSITISDSRPRRQRKLIVDKNEKLNAACSTTTTTPSITTRRRNKNLI